MKVSLASIVGDLEVEEIEIDDAEIVSDVFVIVRTVHPERDHPQTAYTGTEGMQDTVARLGVLQLVSDKVRADARKNWVGDDE